MRFRDRFHAGQELANTLAPYRDECLVVFALPRGGVPVARVVADALGAPLHILVVRKIGHPYMEEYAVAAIAEDGTMIESQETRLLDRQWFDREKLKQQQEAARRRKLYEPEVPKVATHTTAIIVDDGLATGLTMQTAIASLRKQGAKRIVVAVPVAPVESIVKLQALADDVICLHIVAGWFFGVGGYYDQFPQLLDEEVIAALKNTEPAVSEGRRVR